LTLSNLLWYDIMGIKLYDIMGIKLYDIMGIKLYDIMGIGIFIEALVHSNGMEHDQIVVYPE